ncbi:MAG: cation transporter [Candidatus Rokubacteria bacterium]|nr:cation transporter [Candidatus Rokubacteria bacterium]
MKDPHEHEHGNSDSHDRGHHHDRHHAQRHGHSHGVVDPSIASNDRGLWALKWSFVGLFVTAFVQVIVVIASGSVGLLADTIHNFADAATAIPLGIAFWLARRRVTRRFTYGLGRVEDFAGLAVIVTILTSALVAAYESVQRIFHPQSVTLLWAVMAASIVGFVGNEAVALFRIRVGRQIGSAALIADGYHARVDGWTSLAVFVGAVGVWLGYPLADPLVGLAISAAIFVLVWQSARAIFLRMLDGMDSETLQAIEHAAGHVPRVEGVSDVRARWIGHRIHAEVNVTVAGGLSVSEGHDIAREVRHQLLHHLPHLGGVTVHVDPYGQGGDRHHRIGEHAHDGLPKHSHD